MNSDQNRKRMAVFYALLAAVFYALSTPFSKLLLREVPATFMAAFLYIGAGLGVGIMYLFHYKEENVEDRLEKSDGIYTLGMIVLDIMAPIFLMIGISIGSASNASLLGNFEIVATTMIALLVFKETVTGRLWIAIGFITLSSILLSFEGSGSFQFSTGSLFVLLATACWGLENNCTRKISEKSTYEIVFLKGVCSGGGSFMIALLTGEQMPAVKYILITMLLGYVAYGLSIFLYIRAQRDLGASKTSAYYAVAPFVGALLAFLVNKEQLSWMFFIASILMIIGTVFVVYDTLVRAHTHGHSHTIVHTHDHSTHTHTYTHSHEHNHFATMQRHGHIHTNYKNSEEHRREHMIQ